MEFFLYIAVLVLVVKLAPAIARRISGHSVDSNAILRKLDDTEQRLAETESRLRALSEGTHERLLDVEERLDFTERVLQQERERRPLPRGE